MYKCILGNNESSRGGGLLGGGRNAGFVTGPSVSLAVALGNREVPLVARIYESYILTYPLRFFFLEWLYGRQSFSSFKHQFLFYCCLPQTLFIFIC